jgi:MFS transporter, SP family, inositol transporter
MTRRQPRAAAAGARPQTATVMAGMASLLDSAAIITVGLGLPLWRAEYDLGDWSVGLISSSLTISIAIGALVGGRVADLWGRLPVLTALLAVYAAGACLVATAHSVEGFVLGVVVLGGASGANLPASITLVAESAPPGSLGRHVAFTQVMWITGVVLASALGFAVSGQGTLGISMVLAGLAAAASATVAARAIWPPLPPASSPDGHREVTARAAADHGAVRTGADRMRLIVAIGAFYALYNLVANTFGSFRVYFLVVAAGADQTVATAVSFGATLVGLVGAVVFSLIADSRWRRRVYVPGALMLVTSQAMLAVSGADSVTVGLAALALYSLAFPFAGEALYKVWSQEAVPAAIRATAQGATIATARLVAAAFALLTPTLISDAPATLFWVLTAAALASGAIGFVIMRSTRAP